MRRSTKRRNAEDDRERNRDDPCFGGCRTWEEHETAVRLRTCSALTGTLCEAPECAGLQFRCPGGVSCPNGHGFGFESSIPDLATGDDERPSRSASTVYGEHKPSRAARPRIAPGNVRESLASLSCGDFDRIVERVFDVDFAHDYDLVEKHLDIGRPAHRADHATLADALERSETNARIAHRLYVNAEAEREAFEIDAEIILSDMRAQALARLEGQKEGGSRTKNITDADVKAQIAAMFPDEWRDLALRRKRVEVSVEHMKRLAELWKLRCGTLDALVRTKR